MSADPQAVVEALGAAAAKLSHAARAAGSGQAVAIEAAPIVDALEAAREFLLSRRRSLLDDAARRLRNLHVDLQQVVSGTTLDHGHLLAEVGGIERLLMALDQEDGDEGRADKAA